MQHRIRLSTTQRTARRQRPSSTLYSGPIQVLGSETIKAIGAESGYANSSVASATYTLNLPPAATPTISLGSGTYTVSQPVTISDTTTGATIYYTTDGSTPTTSSKVYSGALTLNATETLKAIAVAIGYSPSAVATSAYTVNLMSPGFALSTNPSSLTIPSTASFGIRATYGAAGGWIHGRRHALLHGASRRRGMRLQQLARQPHQLQPAADCHGHHQHRADGNAAAPLQPAGARGHPAHWRSASWASASVAEYRFCCWQSSACSA